MRGYILGVLLCLSGVALCAWTPVPGTSFQWQLQGNLDLSVHTSVFDVDLFQTKDSDMHALKTQGVKIICYFSAGSYENFRNDVHSLPSSVLGNKLEGWPGEQWWDIRAASVRALISARLDRAKSRGCDAVEPDNVDGYSNSNGLGLTKADQLDFNRWIATQAHQKGLSVGLKNAVGLIDDLEAYFDWALNEECLEYNECGGYQRFLSHNKAVFHVEYVDNHSQGASKQRSTCSSSKRPAGFTTLIKDYDLSAWRLTC